MPHVHEAIPHEHPHEHAPHEPQRHEHEAQTGLTKGAVRALIIAFEVGTGLNTEQRKALHAVRVILGDAYGPGCDHENTVYEEGDRLVCQDCRTVV